MRVLIACEFSGVMRRAFRALGHDAWSCDLLPAEDGGIGHIVGDALNVAYEGGWDMMIAHPPCTYLANSGAKHLYIDGKKENGPDPDRWRAMSEAAAFYTAIRAAPIRRKAIENPVMHCHARERIKVGIRQFVQPWWFGWPEFKATGFELIELPPLVATNRLVPPKPGTEEHKQWSKVHRAPPGPDRWKDRSRTFPPIAEACAQQWGGTHQ